MFLPGLSTVRSSGRRRRSAGSAENASAMMATAGMINVMVIASGGMRHAPAWRASAVPLGPGG